MSKTLLTIHDLNMKSREFGDLTHVSFQVPDHGVIGLLGLDGSGIELLCHVISGDPEVFDGAKDSVWLDGKKVRQASLLGNCVRRIRMADTILENWTVAEYLGLSHAKAYIGRRQKQEMRERAEERFRELGLSVDAESPMSTVSELARRTARIIQAIGKGARLLIIEDECLGMKPAEISEYAAVVSQVAADGIPVLFRSQSRQVCEEMCGEFLVFRRGRLVKRWKQKEGADPEMLIKYLLGNTIAAEIKDLRSTQRNVRTRKEITYQVYDLRLGEKRQRFQFYEGEVAALVIGNNLECRDYFDHLSGRVIDLSTRYYLGFKELHCRKQEDFIRQRIVSTMLGNEGYELFGNMSVEDNVLMPSMHKFSAMQYFQQSDNLHKTTRGLLWGNTERKGDAVCDLDQNRRIRIDMERWLMFRPKVLILYEPFSTCDTYGATLISTYIKKFANAGTTVIIVKSNEEYVAELADNIYRIDS